ncbi:EamA family transporter [Terriglobus albidus]|uniref:EamA family transporter n=1 Tax=Terriglobus albidus TaxID=1592106 RepID=UPI0021E0CB5C|nr:EamA family transporter [Terriglobus albidus]
MPTSRKFTAQIIVCFACIYLIWGSTFLAIHYAVIDLAPPIISGLRYFLSAPFIFLLCRFNKQSIRITSSEVWRCGILGAILLVGNNCLLVWAEKTVDSGFAAMVLAAIPIFIALLDTLVPGGDGLTRRGWAGLFLGFAGLMTLLWPTVRHISFSGTGKVFGSVLLLGAALSWAIGSVMSKRFKMQRDPMVLAGWQLLLGGGLNLLIATGMGSWAEARWTRPAVLGLAYLTVFGALIGFTAYVWLLHHVSVAKVATYAYVNPIVASILGIWLLHEGMGVYEWTGMFVILAAVALVNLSKVKKTA